MLPCVFLHLLRASFCVSCLHPSMQAEWARESAFLGLDGRTARGRWAQWGRDCHDCLPVFRLAACAALIAHVCLCLWPPQAAGSPPPHQAVVAPVHWATRAAHLYAAAQHQPRHAHTARQRSAASQSVLESLLVLPCRACHPGRPVAAGRRGVGISGAAVCRVRAGGRRGAPRAGAGVSRRGRRRGCGRRCGSCGSRCVCHDGAPG